MAEQDRVMTEIGRGIELSQAGKQEDARQVYADLWDAIRADGDALHRCALAHAMADVQDDPREELVWDLRALEAADLITDDRVRQAGADSVAGLYPSLHLNLGEVYRKLGDVDRARDHLERGRAATKALGDDGYGRMITGGLDRLADRLANAGT